MIADFSYLQSHRDPNIVIAGSGPAGITLARKLAQNRMNVLLLEAGSELPDSQEFYIGDTVGDPYFYLDVCRLRCFGGTSVHWTGWCRALDSVDFKARPSLDYPGWPIEKSTLDPYAKETEEILEVSLSPDAPFSETLKRIHFSHSPPVNFAEKYGEYIRGEDKITAVLNAALLSIDASDGKVEKIHVRGPDHTTATLEPGFLVICAGGIENSRILLWSNAVSPSKIVANDTTLGRYWMEHPHFEVGDAFDNSVVIPEDGFYSPTEAVMEEYGILNFGLRTLPLNMTHYGWKRNLVCSVPYAQDAVNSLSSNHTACKDGQRLRMAWEQAPDPHNRVTLSPTERDDFGVPRPVLHLRRVDLDYRTAKIGVELYGRHLLGKGIGAARAKPWVINEEFYPSHDELAGYHHMGGTRMSETSASGVVDRNLKIHGMQNAYICGSSVFPTSGHANPTFSIVQLALRLGDHLTQKAI